MKYKYGLWILLIFSLVINNFKTVASLSHIPKNKVKLKNMLLCAFYRIAVAISVNVSLCLLYAWHNYITVVSLHLHYI